MPSGRFGSSASVVSHGDGVYFARAAEATIVMVDTREKLAACLRELHRCPTIAVDLEGVDLGARDAEVAIVQLSTARNSRVFLVDICALGAEAFDTPAGAAGAAAAAGAAPDEDAGVTLRALLEDERVTKLVWDLRSDSASLRASFGVRMRCVVDLQLDDVVNRVASFARAGAFAPDAARQRKRLERVSGLGFVLERTHLARLEAHERERVREVKEATVRLFSPELGGSYAVWKQRPLDPLLVEYCSDTRYLFALRASYALARQRLGGAFEYSAALSLAGAVERRLEFAYSPDFDKHDRDRMVRSDELLLTEIGWLLGLPPAPPEEPPAAPKPLDPAAPVFALAGAALASSAALAGAGVPPPVPS